MNPTRERNSVSPPVSYASSPGWLRRRRRAVIPVVAVAIGLIAAGAAIAVAARHSDQRSTPAPTPPLTPTSAFQPAPAPVSTDLGSGVTLPWPAQGQAAVEAEGLGSLGTNGEQRPVPIASVTKVMTALVVLADHPLSGDDQGPMITVDAKAANEASDPDQTTVRVSTGQTFSEHDLLEMMLIPSGNNIARLLARWDAGNERAFVAKMNDAARRLGMTDTTYTGASGYEESTKSTAVDQLKLARQAVADPVFDRIVAMPTATVPGLHSRLVNTNTLLGADGVIGMKTGSSTPAGGALMWAARQSDANGKTHLVLGVVLQQRQGSTANDDLRAVLATSRTLIQGVAQAVASMR
ncbi:D-alanyl-D-alanine carboxypeptidase [Catenulispora sp. NF23]|uniref:D-alanyl-D-alanine carboxypeptidase family protein n=1 Tax=Catenulispora pinistramenti TaxID=2705254 RepID=UPI001BAC3880|nr:D-alanyl-D-alanine carboxypeptidase [Catenulispora pinistramenti]MBS2534098.1 D-alanyl-D-alanine carboxypeptidase [Catenulispora pinistramenti]